MGTRGGQKESMLLLNKTLHSPVNIAITHHRFS